MNVYSDGSMPISHLGIVLNIITVIFFVLALVAVALRIWSIHLVARAYHIHDYLVCAALVSVLNLAS